MKPKRNIKEAHSIFEEHNDKDGSKICDAFYNALIKNDPDAWMEIIKDKNNLSCPIYRLLKEGSERKIKDVVMLREHFGQVESKVFAKPDAFDGMKNYLDLKFEETNNKVEQGFGEQKKDSQEILEKVDDIQQKVDYIHQKVNELNALSDDIGGKEGENIREFSKQILQIMENEDSETLKRFINNVINSESSLLNEIDQAAISEEDKKEVKETIKSNISHFNGISGKAREFGKNISYDFTSTMLVELIIKYVFPMLTSAVMGVPIPTNILDLLKKAIIKK